MRFHDLLSLPLSILPLLAAAHEGVEGAPRLWGYIDDRKTDIRKTAVRQHRLESQRVRKLQRQEDPEERRCGPGIGSCAANQCCSSAGYCGTTSGYCEAPDCQFNYGPACDTNVVPKGASTSSISRPKLGSVPYGGGGIYSCSVPGTIALTYDDGPFNYTGHVLDLLKQYGAKATFFITGNNNGKGQIDNGYYQWANLIKRAYAEGHQIASHTWGHQDLSQITQQQRYQQMISNEMALRNILGFFPTYMRPPYSSCDAACSADLEALGYHITYFDLDTEDYLNTEPSQVQKPRNNFRGNITSKPASSTDWLVIGHDIHQQTAYSLTQYMLQQLTSAGYKAVTLGECLEDPRENWYRASNGSIFTAAPSRAAPSAPTPSSSAPAKKPTAVSDDGSCGGQSGFTCRKSEFGNCCSQNGWCGKTSAYCGTGCQSAYGKCGRN